MTMKYDVINAIFKNRTDGQSATASGGITAPTTVRHGAAQADSLNGFVEVMLDGSDMAVTVACEATVKKGQRVTVINMGGIYKVVSLGNLQEQIDEARKTATNYITTDTTGAIVISDTNAAINIYHRNSNATMVRVQLNKDHACMNYGSWWYEAKSDHLHMGVRNGFIDVGKIAGLPNGTADADSYYATIRAKRLAMGLNTASVGELAYDSQWVTGFYVRKWGPIVIADIKCTVPSGGWAAGSSHKFGVVASGFKPSSTFRTNAALCDASGRGLQAFAYCNPDGTVAIYNPVAVPAGNDFVGQLVWIAAV